VIAKFIPISVNDAAAEIGEFVRSQDRTGTSNEKCLGEVPTTIEMVTMATGLAPVPVPRLHVTLVDEVQL